ncbi:MAG: hypothetical protein HKN79_11450 [Flavobacteriales bacterium]|nr:hypothetical protein [Flavobacteriales bacterium]
MVRRFIRDIRFWIFLFFCIRLFHITAPPLETGHNWRQTTVTMVARNFVEEDANIFFPRVDFAGERSGITGMEFPLLNYGIYLVSEVCGYDHWYGRLINLIISSLGVYYFFLLVRRVFDREVAFYATLVLLGSIWFSFSRKIMPDTFAVSLVIASLYYAHCYLYDSRHRTIHLLGFTLLAALGMLSKLPAGFLFILLAIPLCDKRVPIQERILVGSASVGALLPVLWWYFFWVPFLVSEYGFWHFFMGNSLSMGWQELQGHGMEVASRFYDDALKFTGFAVFLFGIVRIIRSKQRLALLILILSALSFAIIVIKGGRTFYHHNYYVIPFVPVMALICGHALASVGKNWLRIALVSIIMLEGVINQQHDFRIKEHMQALEGLEEDLDLLTDKDDLILINSGDYPTPMYFAHRKGWVMDNERIARDQTLDSLKAKGLTAVVVLKRTFGSPIDIERSASFDSEDYTIYLLSAD